VTAKHSYLSLLFSLLSLLLLRRVTMLNCNTRFIVEHDKDNYLTMQNVDVNINATMLCKEFLDNSIFDFPPFTPGLE